MKRRNPYYDLDIPYLGSQKKLSKVEEGENAAVMKEFMRIHREGKKWSLSHAESFLNKYRKQKATLKGGF